MWRDSWEAREITIVITKIDETAAPVARSDNVHVSFKVGVNELLLAFDFMNLSTSICFDVMAHYQHRRQYDHRYNHWHQRFLLFYFVRLWQHDSRWYLAVDTWISCRRVLRQKRRKQPPHGRKQALHAGRRTNRFLAFAAPAAPARCRKLLSV